MGKTYRKGAIGALLDVYEQSIADFKKAIENIPDQLLIVVIDPITNEECGSIQAILSHVIHAGFGYATSIHNSKAPHIIRPPKEFHLTAEAYLSDFDKLFSYTETILMALTDHDLEQLDNTLKIKTGWRQSYDIDQLMEHAIVHVLRHTRQILKIKEGLSQSNL